MSHTYCYIVPIITDNVSDWYIFSAFSEHRVQNSAFADIRYNFAASLGFVVVVIVSYWEGDELFFP